MSLLKSWKFLTLVFTDSVGFLRTSCHWNQPSLTAALIRVLHFRDSSATASIVHNAMRPVTSLEAHPKLPERALHTGHQRIHFACSMQTKCMQKFSIIGITTHLRRNTLLVIELATCLMVSGTKSWFHLGFSQIRET